MVPGRILSLNLLSESRAIRSVDRRGGTASATTPSARDGVVSIYIISIITENLGGTAAMRRSRSAGIGGRIARGQSGRGSPA
jgi:hypothetical protein